MAMSSHHSARPGSETWFTPPAIIEALGGPASFDLDPCAAEGQPHATARRQLTVRDNGLLAAWTGRVWLNPPYTNPLLGQFLARLAEHGTGTALIFARTETDAFFRWVWESASAVLFLRGRLHFGVGQDGLYGLPGKQVWRRAGEPAPFNSGAPSVLVAYGDADRDILAVAPLEGRFIPLRLSHMHLVTLASGSWCQELEAWFALRGGAPAALGDLYAAFAVHPKVAGNRAWRAKIRQSLRRGRFERVEKGIWQRRMANG